MKRVFGILAIFCFFGLFACESSQARKMRQDDIERIKQEHLKEQLALEEQMEAERIERERLKAIEAAEQAKIIAKQHAKIRKEKEIYDRYINNSLRTGACPYSSFYGKNSSCNNYGCSSIKVIAPHNSDVLVLIKTRRDSFSSSERVVRHAYIAASSSYTFEMPNGSYQTFFYYGKGWNPNQFMKNTSKGKLYGGFVSEESFGKDSYQDLSNQVLTYELILQKNGNFQTKPSNLNEVF